ncbi:MAG: peptide-methionine (S)-S-oxide reductase MsrA [Pseudomonadota bacterium]
MVRMSVRALAGAAAGLSMLVAGAASAADDGGDETLATAIFAGGCFWCVEEAFDKVQGVISTTSGYTVGKASTANYNAVKTGRTKHTEAVRIVYDPKKVSYQRLLRVFWRNIDPLQANAQFCDRGPQYRTGIYFLDGKQAKLARASKARLEASARFKGKRIATEIEKASTFYAAENYHQDYYKKHPVRYKYYKYGCGRPQRLKQIWGSKAS